MDEVIATLEKTISKEKIRELTYINPRTVLENKELEIENPNKIKEGFWSNIF